MSVQGFLPRPKLARLIEALDGEGYRWVGPQARDGAIVYDTITSADDLPAGLRDRQSPGQYRLQTETGDARLFDLAVGPQGLKPMVFAPRETLWRCERGDDQRLRFTETVPAGEKLAVLGVRACDLAALALQDAHFLATPKADPYYAARRDGLFLVAVHCSAPASTCFLQRHRSNWELARRERRRPVVEVDDGFLVESGSGRGARVCAQLGLAAATDAHREAADRAEAAAIRAQQRRLPGRDLRQRLFDALDHPRWSGVATRCLSCGSQARYRQWMTHKLATWHDQFGSSGCVGCGRCITWCPVGIDITEEAEALCE